MQTFDTPRGAPPRGAPPAKRIIQISDCHLGALRNERLLGLNTDESLEDVLALIAEQEPSIDYLICTGDIASHAAESCYQRFIASVRHRLKAPLAWLPGNHDAPHIMAALAGVDLPQARVIAAGRWIIVLLNSVVPGQVYGHVAEAELEYLESMLDTHPDKHVMIMLHHQPVAVGSAWIDGYKLRNAETFFALIDRFPQVKALVWGHVHQEFSSVRQGVVLLATPSTCVQFKPGSAHFALDQLMPGYRWFDLHEDGHFSTGVLRVTGKHYSIDYKSAGY